MHLLHIFFVFIEIEMVPSTQIRDIISQTKQNRSNYDKWEVEKYSNGICLRNKVTTDRYKKRVCIYIRVRN